jgi:anti-anti-sigma factor
MVDDRSVTCAQSAPVIVALPAEVDLAGSRRLCGQLGSALASAATVIVDMTATTFCDSSGARILLLAHEQAVATGIELRLVVPSARVLRSLARAGADWLLPVYSSLAEALGGKAAEPAAEPAPAGMQPFAPPSAG